MFFLIAFLYYSARYSFRNLSQSHCRKFQLSLNLDWNFLVWIISKSENPTSSNFCKNDDGLKRAGLVLRVDKSEVFCCLRLWRHAEQSLALQNLKTNFQVFLAEDFWHSESAALTPPSSYWGINFLLINENNVEEMTAFQSKVFRRFTALLKLVPLPLSMVDGLPLLSMNRQSTCLKPSIETLVTIFQVNCSLYCTFEEYNSYFGYTF